MFEIDYKLIAKKVFNYINDIRKNPFKYIPKIKELTTYYKNKMYSHPKEIPIETNEGPLLIEEAMVYLHSQRQYDPLIYSEEISQACFDHVKDIGSSGLTTHIGSDGSNITDRIERYCEWDGMLAENLDFGFIEPENIVINMILDDGVKDRYQRKNIFNPNFKYIGVGVGKHKVYEICTVVGFAMDIRKIGTEPKDVSDWIKKYYDEHKVEEENIFLGNSINDTLINSSIMNIGRKRGSVLMYNDLKIKEPDAPDNSMKMKMSKVTKIINGKEKNYTKKYFPLKNGVEHIVEIEEPS